ncbi:MAG: MFS transporter [Deltaproteobacteria bacterium]|nr:MFS transporter [Deltaproteobacteria bacterium]
MHAKATPKQPLLRSPHVWAFTTYFAEGFPYTIIRMISPVFFRDRSVSLEAIGLTSLFGIPWVIKFLWGPLVDEYSTKRNWMLSTQFFLLVMAMAAAFLSWGSEGVRIVAALFFVGSFIAATHDMAIDGYYMEALDEEGQARFVGYRVMAYRIAMMTGTGVIVTIGAIAGWPVGFFSAGAILALLFTYHALFLPRVERQKKPFFHFLRSLLSLKILAPIFCLLPAVFLLRAFEPDFLGQVTPAGVGLSLLVALVLLALLKDRIKATFLKKKDSFYAKAFLTYMDRKKIGITLAFIIFMRTGESMLTSMVSPFMVDLGIKAHYGWISGGVGLPFSIFGAVVGGWMISRYTLRKTIWPFLLAQNSTNLLYMALAFFLSPYVTLNTGAETVTAVGSVNLLIVASVHGFDQFAGGLGTAVLVTFLMRTCLSEYKAAHFAIGTGLMNLSGVFSGILGGFLAGWLGYGVFFGLSFLASLPGMALVFFIPSALTAKKDQGLTS